MSKVITFSTQFPKGHIRQGQPTYFVEKFWNQLHSKGIEIPTFNFTQYISTRPDGLKYNRSYYDYLGMKSHTIRAGNRFKKGEYFSPRIWSKTPYNSPQITFAPDTLITDVWNILIFAEPNKLQICEPMGNETDFQLLSLGEVARNDGLSIEDFISWFNPKKETFEKNFQIICWNENIKY